MAVSINVNWERRLCMYPAYFDEDGLMYSNTAYGDYPHFAPAYPGRAGEFAGWMLLSYKKPVKTSTHKGENSGENLTDENVKTYWLAEDNSDKQWVELDLVNTARVHAIQINYHDHESKMYGRIPGLYHRYVIEGSIDGNNWTELVDRSNSYKDVPNDYVELNAPQSVRYVRYRNIHVPTPNLAISDLRIFGKGNGRLPATIKGFTVTRKTDRRDVHLKWNAVPNSQGYNIRWGIAPDKLYNSWLVYSDTSLLLKSLTVDQTYYFTVEAFNENGISERTKPVKVD